MRTRTFFAARAAAPLLATALLGCSTTAGSGGAAPAQTTLRTTASALATNLGSCAFTEDCGKGTYCDPTVGQCQKDCDATTACAPGLACSSAGHCEAASGPQPARPALSVSATVLYGTAPLTLTLQVGDGATAAAAKPIVVLDGQGFAELACTAPSTTSAPTGGYAPTCTLDGWKFQPQNGLFVATKTVWARPLATPPAGGKSPEIAVRASGVTGTTRAIGVVKPPAAPTSLASPDAWGEYQGELRKIVLDPEPGINLADEGHVTVRAYVTAKGILVVDPSRSISESGRAFLVPDADAAGDQFLLPQGAQSRQDNGFYLVRTSLFDEPVFGVGTLDVTVASYTPRSAVLDSTAKLSLRKVAPLPTASCSSTTACGDGQTCDATTSLCVDGPAVPGITAFAPDDDNGGFPYPRHKNIEALWGAVYGAIKGDPPGRARDVAAEDGAWIASFDLVPRRQLPQNFTCYSGIGNGAYTQSTFVSALLKNSRELACGFGGNAATKTLPLALPMMVVADKPSPADATTPSDMLKACLNELEAGPPSALAADPGARIDQLFADGTCVRLASFASALRTSSEDEVYRYALLRKWLELHGFLASQGLVEWQAATVAVASSSTSPDDLTNASAGALSRILDTLERGWDLVFSKFAYPSSGAESANRDYRDTFSVALSDSDPQAEAFPAKLLDTMTLHLQLEEAFARDQATQIYSGTCDATQKRAAEPLRVRMGRTLRYAELVRQYALRFLNSASQSAPWFAHYRASLGEFVAARQRVVDLAGTVASCGNPLGIDDASLPLYFGDPSGDSNRFFASSDYLLGLAKTAVGDATGGLDKARAAWVSARQSQLQQAVTEQERSRRLDELQQRYGTVLMETCGITGATAADTLANFSFDKCTGGEVQVNRVAIQAAQSDVDLAYKTWIDARTGYDTQVRYCTGLQKDVAAQATLSRAHLEEMANLEDAKVAAEDVMATADAVQACSDGWGNFFSFGGKCASAVARSVSEGFLNDFNRQIANADRSFSAAQTAFQNDLTVKACFNDAAQRHIGLGTAQAQIARRALDVQEAYARLYATYEKIGATVNEGNAAVERERKRTVDSFAFHYWVKDEAAKFQKSFLLAQRLVFLATQATEFDTQQSFGTRLKVVRAHSPQDLTDALNALANAQNTRTVLGQRPEELTMVLSLRDDILGLRYDKDTGKEYGVADINYRLRERFRAPEAAIFDSTGTYIGQGIRFTLSPRAETHFRCAERLWSVSASVVGESLSTSRPTGQIQFAKLNTATSKWCGHLGDGSPLQIGRPQTQGFLYGLADGTSTSLDDAPTFQTAQLTPWFNLSRADLERPENGPSRSDELAGRGLYGDYVLIFPYVQMLDDATRFNLEGLEDVLLRLDYYSVNNLQL